MISHRETNDRFECSSSDSESEDVSGGTLHIDLDKFTRKRPRSPSPCSSTGSNTTIHLLSLEVNSMPAPAWQFEVSSSTRNPYNMELPKVIKRLLNKGGDPRPVILRSSWQPFVEDNGLQVGDTVIFSKVYIMGQPTISVEIVKRPGSVNQEDNVGTSN